MRVDSTGDESRSVYPNVASSAPTLVATDFSSARWPRRVCFAAAANVFFQTAAGINPSAFPFGAAARAGMSG